jgi:hypothetical protein
MKPFSSRSRADRPSPELHLQGPLLADLLSDLMFGEQVLPEAELNALGQDLLPKLAIRACEAAQPRYSPTFTQADIEVTLKTMFRPARVRAARALGRAR